MGGWGRVAGKEWGEVGEWDSVAGKGLGEGSWRGGGVDGRSVAGEWWR